MPRKKQKVNQSTGFQDSAEFSVRKAKVALTITSNLTTINEADSIGGWSVNANIAAGWGLNSDEAIESGGCISGQSKNTTGVGIIKHTSGADIDLSSEWLRVWLRFTEIPKMVTHDGLSEPGASIYVEDSSGNWGLWGIGGSDGGLSEAWENYVVNTEDPFHSTSATAPTMTAIRAVGVAVRMATKPSRADNIFIDAIRYGDGLTITGTNAIVGDGFSEIADADETSTLQYGVFRRDRTGNYILKGKLVFGDATGTGSVDFTDNQNSKIFIPQGVNDFGGADITNQRYSGSFLSGRANLGFEIVGNATGTTNFQLGTLLGTGDNRQGILGGTISSLGGEPFIFNAEGDTGDIDTCELYGVTFEGAGTINLSGATTQEAIGCTFVACEEIQPNTVEFLNNRVIAPVDRGLELLSGNNVKFVDFISGDTGDKPVDFVVNTEVASDPTFSFASLAWNEYTIEANNDTTDDVNILGTGTTDNDNAGYIGYRQKFGKLKINTSTARVGGTVTWQYWDGTSWTNLTVISDGTNTLSTTGEQELVFTPPLDWAKRQLRGTRSLYYIRLNATASRTTNPLIQRIKVADVYEAAIHCPATGAVTASDLTLSGYLLTDGGWPKWHVENSNNAVTVDSYAETNQSSSRSLTNTGTISRIAQTFTATAGKLTNARFYLKKTNTPTGNIVAKLYATSGGAPTGEPLATSEANYDASRLDATNYQLIQFEFDDEFTLVASTVYAISVEYTATSTNTVDVGTDNTSPAHSGTLYEYNGTSWSSVAGHDAIFYVSRDGHVDMTVTGGTDPTTDVSTGDPPGATTITNQVDIAIKVIDAKSLANVQGARVYLTAAAGGDLAEGTTILTPASQLTDVNGEVNDTFNYTSDQPVTGWVRRGTSTPLYSESPLTGTITIDGFSATAPMVSDEG